MGMTKTSSGAAGRGREAREATVADWDTSGGVPPDDIISESSQHWFDNSDEWYEPTYKEVNARKGSVLEKVQRMHLNEPSDFSFKDGEYFDLMGYVKEKTDNEFCLVWKWPNVRVNGRLNGWKVLVPNAQSVWDRFSRCGVCALDAFVFVCSRWR